MHTLPNLLCASPMMQYHLCVVQSSHVLAVELFSRRRAGCVIWLVLKQLRIDHFTPSNFTCLNAKDVISSQSITQLLSFSNGALYQKERLLRHLASTEWTISLLITWFAFKSHPNLFCASPIMQSYLYLLQSS